MKAPPVSFSKLPWHYVACASSELRLDIVLKSGQSFRWRETKDGDGDGGGGVVWAGVLASKLWHLSQPDSERIGFKVYPGGEEDDAIVRDYFQLHVRAYVCGIEIGGVDREIRDTQSRRPHLPYSGCLFLAYV